MYELPRDEARAGLNAGRDEGKIGCGTAIAPALAVVLAVAEVADEVALVFSAEG